MLGSSSRPSRTQGAAVADQSQQGAGESQHAVHHRHGSGETRETGHGSGEDMGVGRTRDMGLRTREWAGYGCGGTHGSGEDARTGVGRTRDFWYCATVNHPFGTYPWSAPARNCASRINILKCQPPLLAWAGSSSFSATWTPSSIAEYTSAKPPTPTLLRMRSRWARGRGSSRGRG